MSTNLTPLLLAAAILAIAPRLSAQSNKPPGPTDYNAFSGFVATRNIFDPSRQPHYTSSGSSSRRHTHSRTSVSTPSFIFVGALSYEKGLFAFFSGNETDLKQILTVNQVIAGYTVKEITLDSVSLVSADGKAEVEMKVGDVMRQDGTKWENTGVGEVPAGSPATATATDSSGSGAGPASGSGSAPAAATLTPDSAPNDILKRLMEQRQKESQ